MKKKNLVIICSVCVIALFAGILAYMQVHKNDGQEAEVPGHYIGEEETEKKEEFDIEADIQPRLAERKEGDIIWTVSDDVLINEDYLELLNKRLKQDGYDFQLKFQYLNTEYYNEGIRKVLEDGDTDIALGGQDTGEFENVVAGICRDGLFLELSPYLESDACKALWEEYEEPLWKSVSVDGKIYTVPNGIYDDGRLCVVFNNKYIAKNESKKFTGDITGLEAFLTEEMRKEPKGREFLITWDSSNVAVALGYYQRFGAYFNAETGEVSSPFDCKELYQFLEMLNAFQKAGCVPKECSLRSGTPNKKIKKKIERKEFSILLTTQTDTIEAMKDDVTVATLDFSPNFARVGGTNGICAKSENAEAAMKLLALLHTQDEYAHLLLYGEEGKDYKIEKGKIVSDDFTGIWTVDALGIYRSSYPEGEERNAYTKNIRQQKREVYRSEHCRTSAVAGFQADGTVFSEEEMENADTAESNLDIWKKEDFEKQYQNVKKAVAEAEGSIVKKLANQLEEWKSIQN